MKAIKKSAITFFALTVLVMPYAQLGNAMESAMIKDGAMADHKLTNTSLPISIPLTKGYVNDSEVFYISTEASDKDLADHLTKVTGFKVVFAPSLAKTPASALANIYAFTNGIPGSGPLGFQPNVADSQPGDSRYSPLWNVNMVEWKEGSTPRELKSESEIMQAQSVGEITITTPGLVVNCPFVKWNGGQLQVRTDKTLTDDTQYGGGQVLDIDTEKMQVTFVAHRGFAPDGSTIYYIATDASVQEVADMLGVQYVEKTGSTLATSAASDLYVFTNGIVGSGPMRFQASIASTNIGDAGYSPLWRILGVTWNENSQISFLTQLSEITSAATNGALGTEIAGVVVNCPFVQVKMMGDTINQPMMEKENMSPRMQMASGISAHNVICKSGLELIFKATDGSAACVNPSSVMPLIERGWAMSKDTMMNS